MPEPKTILLVEDEAIILLATSQKIQKFGYQVCTASSGEKAIQFVIENPDVSLILMDINLGKGMDGTETARKILEIKHIPIVFLTSHIEDEYIQKVKSITKYGYVLKNSTDFVLKYAIEMAFELFAAFQKTKESEERLTKFIQSAVHGYIFLDENGLIQDVNLIALQIGNNGLEKDKVIGLQIFEVFPFLKDFEREIKLGHQQIKFEKEVMISNQAWGSNWVRLSIFPVNSGLGILLEDITIDKLIADTQLFLSQKGWHNNEESFFESLIRFLCVYLHMDVGFVAFYEENYAKSLAFYKDGVILDNFKYEYEHFPCKRFKTTPFICYPKDIQKLFPEIEYFKTYEIESMIGISLWNVESKPLGFIELQSNMPIHKPEIIKIILQLVSGRAAGEIERLGSKAILALEKQRLEGYLNIVQTVLLAIDEHGIIVLANKKACEVSEYEEDELIGYPISKLFFYSSELESFEVKVNKILTANDTGENENYLKTKSGKSKLMRWQNSVFQDVNSYYILSSGEDITEKRINEQALLDSEIRFKTMFESAPVAMTITRLVDGKIIEVNQAAKSFFAYNTEEVTNKTSVELKIWKSEEERNKFVSEVNRNKEVIKYSAWMQNRHGKEFLANISAKVITIKQEPHLVSIIDDITEKNNQWKDLLTTNDFLKSILNSSLDAIFVKDIRLRHVLCNQKYVDIVGKSLEELLGKTDLEIGWSINEVKGNDKEGYHGFENDDLKALNGEVIRIPYDKITIGDQIRYFDTIKLPLKDSENKIIGVLGIARDITERQQFEETIKKSESLFRALFEQAAIGVAQIDSKTGKFIRINRKYTEIIGYSLEEIKKIDFMSISHPDELKEDLNLMNKLIKGEIREFSMEKKLFKKGGQTIWVKLTVSPVWQLGEEPNFHIAVVEDITNQKKAAAELLDSKKLYESLVDVSPAAICVISIDWEILMVSKQLLKLFDFENDTEVIGQPIFNWIENNFHQDVLNVFSETIDHVKSDSHICTFKKKNAELFIGRVELTTLTNENGELMAFLAFIIDVSKEIAYENQLKEASDFNAALLNMSPNAIFVYDLQKRKNIYSNHRMMKILGYHDDEMNEFKTDTLKKIMHPDDYHNFIHKIYPKYLNFEQEEILTYEYRLKHVSGKWLWFKANELVFSKNELGKPKEILGVIENITDLKEKELILKQSDQFFNSAIAESNVAIWKFSMHQLHTYLWFSPRFYELIGYQQDDFNQTFDILNLIHPEDMVDNVEKFRHHLVTKEPYISKYRILTKSGKYKWFAFNGNTNWLEDSTLEIAGTIIDIDAQMEVEKQLQKLVEEKDLLLHEVHHRIKNNMSTIISLLQLQSTEIKNQDTIDSFSTAINRIRSMMLLYDKLYNSSNVAVISGKEYLEELAREVISEFPNSLTVDLHLDIDEFIVESGTMSSLGMIINELISNAMKYAFKDEYFVQKGNISLISKIENQNLKITLSDNGIGLPDHVDFDNETGFGLKFIKLLSQQIQATIEIIRKNGTKFEICISLNEHLQ